MHRLGEWHPRGTWRELEEAPVAWEKEVMETTNIQQVLFAERKQKTTLHLYKGRWKDSMTMTTLKQT
jgi:hypothetical protein